MGNGVIDFAEILWSFDVSMALICGVAIPFLMFTRQQHSIDQMTAIWLLPIVAAEVAATSGGLLAPYLAADHQLIVLIISDALWAYSVPIAFSILAILLLRLALHKLPHESMAASTWLALGPIGTASLGMLVLGGDSLNIFNANHLPLLANVIPSLGILIALIMWGCGLWWFLLALLITIRYFKNGIPFNLGWWAYTFPLGVYALASLRLGNVLHMMFFSVFGGILVLALSILWLIVTIKTLIGAYTGALFFSPCINQKT